MGTLSRRTFKRLASNRKTALVAASMMLSILLLSAFGYFVWRDYAHTLEAARESNQGLAVALEEHTQRSIEAVELGLEGFAKELNGQDLTTWSPGKTEWEYYRQFATRLPQVSSVGILDKAGNIRLLTASYPWPTYSVADRGYFKAHRDQGLKTYVGTPALSRATGKLFFTLGLRLNDKQGNFNGVVLASFEIDYFRHFYRSLNLGQGGSVAVIRADGKPLIREPSFAGYQDRDLAKDALFTRYIPQSPIGTFFNNSPFDNQPRLASYRFSPQYSLVVVATRSVAELVRPVKERAIW